MIPGAVRSAAVLAPSGGGGSGERRRYAAQHAMVRVFLGREGEVDLSMVVLGPVRHAPRYNRALKAVHEADPEPVREAKRNLDVEGFVVVLERDAIRHATRRHGNPRREAQLGQLPVSPNDFPLVPQILGDPDEVEPGETKGRGTPSVRAAKTISGVEYIVVAEARAKVRQLAVVTLFKRPARG